MAGVRITFGKEVLPSPGSERNQINGMRMRKKKVTRRDQTEVTGCTALFLGHAVQGPKQRDISGSLP